MPFVAKIGFRIAATITCIETLMALARNSHCFLGRRFKGVKLQALCFADMLRRGLERYESTAFDLVATGSENRRAGSKVQHDVGYVARQQMNMGHSPIPSVNR